MSTRKLRSVPVVVMAAAAVAGLGATSAGQSPNEEWVATLDAPVGEIAATHHVALAPFGVVVAGIVSSETGIDFVVIGYDTDGDELWTAQYDGPSHYFDQVMGLAVDAAGNAYVTGVSSGVESIFNYDFATIKYGPNGEEQWVARYDSVDLGYDVPGDIAIDASGNVYVTGSSSPSSDAGGYATIKYDAGGRELWVALYHAAPDSEDGATAVALDAAGNVYVTGEIRGTRTAAGFDIEADIGTIKYDADGNELWVEVYNSPDHGWDDAVAIEIDDASNVHVLGETRRFDPNQVDLVVIKYDTDGERLWVATHPLGIVGGSRDMKLDASGHVYVTASGVGENDLVYVTAKYDGEGNQIWSAVHNSPGTSWESPVAIELDQAANVYVTGLSQVLGEGEGSAMIKYDTDGQEIWTLRRLGIRTYAIVVDASTRVYVTGQSTDQDIVTIKYSQCTGDTNTDDAVDVIDLVAVIVAWGTGTPEADVNDDGTVDGEDLAALLLNWGACGPTPTA